MPSVEDLQFDTTGWEPRPEAAESRRAWVNLFGDVLSLRYTAGVPKVPSLFRQQALRDYYILQIAASRGCILSLELIHVKGLTIGKLIFKTPQPGETWGYMGSLTLAYKDFSYTIRLQAMDGPGDGARSQHVWSSLHENLAPGENPLALWYGHARLVEEDIVRPCLADGDYWDAQFPTHPLSRLRAELTRIAPTLIVSRDVKNSQPHRG